MELQSHDAGRPSPRMSVEEAARYIGLSVAFLNKARLTGSGPTFLKLGRRVAYDVSDLNEWLNSRRRTSTSQGVAA